MAKATAPAFARKRDNPNTRCTVCRHPERHAIEMARLAGATLSSVEGKYGLSKWSVFRHMSSHVSGDRRAQLIADVPLTELAAKAAAENLSLLDYLGLIRATVIGQMLAAASVNDKNGTAILAGKATDVLREIGKLSGELMESARSITTINNNVTQTVAFMASPLFGQLEAMLMKRLAPYPEAMRAVVDGLMELQGHSPTIDGIALPTAEGFHVAA